MESHRQKKIKIKRVCDDVNRRVNANSKHTPSDKELINNNNKMSTCKQFCVFLCFHSYSPCRNHLASGSEHSRGETAIRKWLPCWREGGEGKITRQRRAPLPCWIMKGWCRSKEKRKRLKKNVDVRGTVRATLMACGYTEWRGREKKKKN